MTQDKTPTLTDQWMAFRRNPSETGFQILYNGTSGLVYTICYRILRNEEDASDAFQSTWSRLFMIAKLNDKLQEQEVGAERIITRTAVREADALRKRRNRRARKEIVMKQLPPAPQKGLSAHDMASNTQVRERIETLVSSLPEKLRLPIMLYYFDGMSQPQIAEALETPVSTIAARIKKGLKNLKPMMRRAGLGEAITIFAAMAGTGVLLSPPSALAATVVFAKASAAAATATVAAGTTASASATVTSGGLFAGAKAIIASVVAVVVIGSAAVLLPNILPEKKGAEKAGNTLSPIANTQDNPSVIANGKGKVSPTSTTLAAEVTPTREMSFLLKWEDSDKPVAGTSLTLLFDARGEVPPVETKTNRAGIFQTEIPPEQESVTLRVSNEFALDWIQVALSETTTTEVQVPRLGRIRGQVRDAVTGKAVAGAKVAAFDWEDQITLLNRHERGMTSEEIEDKSGPWVESDEKGNFVLGFTKAGRYAIYAQKDAKLSYKNPKEMEWKTAEMGKEKGPHTLALYQVSTITGVVTDAETGDPVAGATISIEDKSITYRGANITVRTDSAGGYTLPVPRAQRYDIIALAPKHALTMKNIAAKENDVAICDFQLTKGGTVEVLAVTREGKPIEGARVNLSLDDYTDSPQHPVTNAEGKALLTGVSLITPGYVSAHSKEFNSCNSDRPSFPAGKMRTSVRVVLSKSQSDNESNDEEKNEKVWTVTGLVTDAAGTPLEGITVAWGTYSVSKNDAQCKTGVDGTYTLNVSDNADLESQWAALWAYGKGFAPQWNQSVRPGSQREPASADIKMQPGHWLNISLVDEAQKPIEGAMFSLSKKLGRYSFRIPDVNSRTKSDKEGIVKYTGMPEGKVSISISKTGFSSTEKEYEVDQEVTITLKDYGVLTGRVVDAETEEPVQSINIKLRGPNVASTLRERGADFWDKDGKFEFKKINREGTFEMTFNAKGYSSLTKKDIQASPTNAPKEMEIRLQPAAKTKGHVVDAITGSPIAGATIIHGKGDGGHTSLEWGSQSRGGFALEDVHNTITKSDGKFEFFEPEPGYYLQISHKDYARHIITPTQRIAFKDPATGEITIALRPGATIVATLTDGGKAKSGEKAQMSREDFHSMNFSQRFESVTTDASGKMEWRGLEAGEYRISVAGMHREVEVKGGERKEVDLALAHGTLTLSGRVLHGTKPLPNIDVQLSRTRVIKSSWFGLVKGEPDNYPSNFNTRSDKEGNYKFENLPEGKYNLSAYRHVQGSGAQHAREEFEMNADMTVDLLFFAKNRIFGRIKFPPNTSKQEQLDYLQIEIRSEKHISFTNTDQIDDSGDTRVAGGEFEITGRFKGVFNAAVTFRKPNGNTESLPIPIPLKLDNREGDQDVGEIVIPAKGQGAISGQVVDLKGNPIAGASISASPVDQNAGVSRSANSDKDGIYQIENLKDIAYRVYATKSLGSGQEALRAPSQEIELKGNATANFILFGSRKLTGRLTGSTPEAVKIIASIESLSFNTVNDEELRADNPLNISTGGSAREISDGHFTITGRYHGEYIMNVRYRTEDKMTYEFPVRITLNNLEQDQNLGDVPLPAFGSLVMQLEFLGLTPDPKQLMMSQLAVLLYPEGVKTQPTIRQLDTRKPAPWTLPNLPVGSYDVAMYSMCFHTKEKMIKANVKPGGLAETVTFTMVPEGAIMGSIDSKIRSEDYSFAFSRVTISGPVGKGSGKRVLVPNPNLSENEAFLSGMDFTRRSMFVSRNLKPGNYTITLEASGYEPTSVNATVVLGQLTPLQQIIMKGIE